LKQRAKSLMNFTGLFAEVTKKDVTGQQLLQNLQDQLDTVKSWQENLAELTARGVDEGLLGELQGMGPGAADELSALNSLTSEELNKYVEIYKEKAQLANEAAAAGMEDQRLQMRRQLEDIRYDASAELDQLRKDYQAKIADINAAADEELSKLQSAWQESLAKINADAQVQVNTLSETMKTASQAIEVANADALTAVGKTAPDWKKQGEDLVGSTRDGITGQKAGLVDEAKSLGKSAVDGLAAGLLDNASAAVDAARNVAGQVAAAMSSALEISSPSKVMARLGAFAAKGLAKGMLDAEDVVLRAAQKLGIAAQPDIPDKSTALISANGGQAGSGTAAGSGAVNNFYMSLSAESIDTIQKFMAVFEDLSHNELFYLGVTA